MSQWDQFDNQNNENEEAGSASGSYQSENSADIYSTPDVTREPFTDVPAGDTSSADVVVDSTAVEEAADSTPAPYNYNPYSYTQYADNQNNNPYGGQALNDGQSSPYNNYPYGNNSYNNNQSGSNPYNNQFGNNPYSNGQNGGAMYNNSRNGGNPYNNNQNAGAPYINNPYGGSPYNNNPYGSGPYNNNPYDGSPYNNGQYGGNSYNNNQYANNSYNNQYNNPYGGQIPPGNNQYSPYDVPPKKNKNGLILGIVIAVIVLFLIAVFALAYKAVSLLYGNETGNRNRSSRNEYSFNYDDDDDWGVKPKNREDRDRDDNDDDDNDDDWYDDDDWDFGDYDDYYDEDSEYYSLHDDLKWDLSYGVDFEEYDDYDYDEGVQIYISYPVIEGDDVPNLDRLNDAIYEEVEFLTDLADDMEEDIEFALYAESYVTYMDEEKLSIVFHENAYVSDDDGYWEEAYYLSSINIDMKNGVVMDNQNIISADDDFSVDFRQRSDIQNGEISYLTMMTDQEITDYFNSDDIIIFYTPKGMEIGFNYDEGWVTVTYEDYEQYLKVF